METDKAAKTEEPVLLMPGVAARRVGVVTRTLVNWHRAGLITALVTPYGQRRYLESEITALAGRTEAVA